ECFAVKIITADQRAHSSGFCIQRNQSPLRQRLLNHRPTPAVVLDVTKKKNVVIQLPGGRRVALDRRALGFAARAVDNEKM
ncbi:hypothetical protein C5B28_13515, partial [Neisseria gonorrhoeae]